MARPKTILIVEDEPRARDGFRRTLEAWSTGRHRILCADNGAEALRLLEETLVDVLVTDIRMPGVDGLDLIEHVRRRPRPPVCVLISGYPEFEYAQRAIRLGVVNYLLKPVDRRKLVEAVEQALAAGEERERIERMSRLVDEKLITAEDEGPSNPSVRAALQYVEERLHEPLHLRDVAEHVHLNPSYFSALFKEQTGLTFSEYVARSRIRKAKQLLLSTALPVEDIAERVGYRTAKYFIKVFRDYEGVSPSRYRREMAGERRAT